MSDMENPNWGSPTSLPAVTGSRGTAGARGSKYALNSIDHVFTSQKLGVNPVPKAETDVAGWGNLSKRMTGTYTPKTLTHHTSDLQAGGTGRGSFSPLTSPAGFNPTIGEF